jgi:hypothetical protein
MSSNAVGCDSTATLTFTVLPTSTSTTILSAVAPYSWNGQSLTASGVYTYATINAAGCDSIATLNFTVLSYCWSTPIGLVVSSIATSTATASWTAVPGASWYGIRYKPVGSSSWTTITSTSTSKSLTGLISNTIYEVQVKSYCSSSTSGAWSVSVQFTTLILPCATIPTGIAISSISTSNATVSWTALSGVSWYAIRYKPVSSSSWITITTSNTSKTLNGLISNTLYEVQVQSNCSSTLFGAWSASTQFTTANCSATPIGLVVSSVTATTVTASWTAVPGASWYGIRYKPVASSSWTTITSTSTSKTLSGLLSNTLYEVQVKSYCSSGISGAWSVSAQFTTLILPCATIPTGIAISSISTSNATVSWTALSGVSWYAIRYKPVSSSYWITITTSSTSKILTGLISNTLYEVQVQSNCSSSISGAWSVSVQFTTASCTATPIGLVVSSIATSTATASWTAVPGASWYGIRYRPVASGSWTTITSSSSSKTLTGLISNTLYEVQVNSYCSNGISGAWSASVQFTTLILPCATIPTGISISSISTSNATVSWTALSGVSWYEIRYKPVSSSSWITITTSNSSKTLTGLTSNTLYEVQVKSYCSSSISGAWSVSVQFTTASCTATPIGLVVSSVATTTATASWTAVSGASWYGVRYKRVASSTWTTITTSSNSKTISGLLSNTLYEVQVSSYCSSGISGAWSASVQFTTLTLPCATIPTGIAISSISSSKATVSWTALSGASWYGIRYKPVSSSAWISITTSSTSKILTGLLSNTLYEVQVQSNCSSSLFGAWSVSTEFTVGTSSKQPSLVIASNEINVFPNPTSGELNIELTMEQEAIITLKIMDISGRIVKQVQSNTFIGENTVNVNLSELNAGLYIIQVINNNQLMHTSRITKN